MIYILETANGQQQRFDSRSNAIERAHELGAHLEEVGDSSNGVSLRYANLLERMDPEQLSNLEEANILWPSTMDSIKEELALLDWVNELSFGTARRIANDLNMNLDHLILIFH
jgi:hypothetical protein